MGQAPASRVRSWSGGACKRLTIFQKLRPDPSARVFAGVYNDVFQVAQQLENAGYKGRQSFTVLGMFLSWILISIKGAGLMTRNHLKKACLLAGHFIVALTLCASNQAIAGTGFGKVKFLLTRTHDGLQYVKIKGERAGKPACATNDYFMIRDEKSDTGKAQYAMLMSAYLAGKIVAIEGAGTCNRWGDGEDIESVYFFDDN